MKVKVINIDTWDEDTGESDITIKVNDLELVCFSDERFILNQEYEASLFILANSWQIINDTCKYIKQDKKVKYLTEISGKIVNVSIECNDCKIIVDCEKIIIPVYIIGLVDNLPQIGEYIHVQGRLDIRI